MPKERETSSRGQGGNRARDLSPETRAAGPRDKTPTVPGARALEAHFNIKQEQYSAANTTRNACGQKSTPHFVRACAVETHFNIKQKHESDKYHAKRSRTEVANSLCASLRSRNALRHQARARICGTYHAKRSGTERAPQSGTKAFSLTVRTPYCLGNKRVIACLCVAVWLACIHNVNSLTRVLNEWALPNLQFPLSETGASVDFCCAVWMAR